MPTPSPLCNVNGSAPPQAVAAGSTVTGGLVSTAGANSFSVFVSDTDELNTVAAVQATLTINQTLKTFQFTAPATLGSAVQLTCQVGIVGLQLDANGIKQPSLATTFKVNVLTSGGLSVLTTNETVEQSATSGWVGQVNAAIRIASATASAPVDLTVGTGGATSVSTIPSGAKVWRVLVNITTSFSTGATLNLGRTGSSSLLLSAFDVTQPVGQYVVDMDTAWGGSALPVVAAIAGSPASGAADVFVFGGLIQT